jgi:hypothetical protein
VASRGANRVALAPSRAASTTRFQANAARTTSRSPIGMARIGRAAGRSGASGRRRSSSVSAGSDRGGAAAAIGRGRK